ncbi:MAG: hypothetical protein MJZ61_08510 [Bacteroidales bacterium]|nr:hypothetical protein [Bacteroidales bacterium]
MKTSKLTLIASLAIAISACNAPKEADEKPFESTVVNPDGTVTFYYKNDNADSVKVDVQFAGRNNMQRDSASGIWTATLGPADPDMYPYCFVVDGVSIMDPECREWFPNEGFKNSILDIPGKDGALIHSIQNVPHGDVHYETYYSKSLGCYNRALVYTPASYSNSSDSLPVFYLISGTTDTEEVYYKVGRMNYILDNLIAQGKAKDMIIVLPYGNPGKLLPQGSNIAPIPQQGDLFSKDFVNDLMPYVEANYRTINDRDHRAIGGFSRGGNQALFNGLCNIDKFSYLCSYSSFTTTDLPVYNDKDFNDRIHLFWLGIGTDDFLYGTSRDYLEFLDSKGITAVKEFTTGKFGHTWMNAKYFLARTMPMLFNPEVSAKAMAEAKPAPKATGNEVPFTPGVMARLFPKPIISPEFIGNDSVTFRFKAENAKAVSLEMESSAPIKMTRDSAGVWSVTMVPSGLCYNFVVDGIRTADPQNMYMAYDSGIKRSILHKNTLTDKITKYNPMTYKTAENGERYAVCEPAGVSGVVKTIKLEAPMGADFECWHKILRVNELVSEKPCRLILANHGSNIGNDADLVLNIDKAGSWTERMEMFWKAIEK